jgi:hypothetical protein
MVGANSNGITVALDIVSLRIEKKECKREQNKFRTSVKDLDLK